MGRAACVGVASTNGDNFTEALGQVIFVMLTCSPPKMDDNFRVSGSLGLESLLRVSI